MMTYGNAVEKGCNYNNNNNNNNNNNINNNVEIFKDLPIWFCFEQL